MFTPIVSVGVDASIVRVPLITPVLITPSICIITYISTDAWSASHTHFQASTLTFHVNMSLYMQEVRLKHRSHSIACMDVQKTLGYLSRRCTDVERSKQTLLRLALCVDFFLRRYFKQKQLQFELNPFT